MGGTMDEDEQRRIAEWQEVKKAEWIELMNLLRNKYGIPAIAKHFAELCYDNKFINLSEAELMKVFDDDYGILFVSRHLAEHYHDEEIAELFRKFLISA